MKFLFSNKLHWKAKDVWVDVVCLYVLVETSSCDSDVSLWTTSSREDVVVILGMFYTQL